MLLSKWNNKLSNTITLRLIHVILFKHVPNKGYYLELDIPHNKCVKEGI